MGIFDNFLGQVFNSPYQLKSYAHASRLYLDDYYKYVPKIGFLYYVVINISQNARKVPLVEQFVNTNGQTIGMLVKQTELPKFRMATEVLNQYNRKAYVQSKIEYQPISMTFHDDHNNTSTALWEAYYRYYFADDIDNTQLNRPLPPSKYMDTPYSVAEPTDAFSYGLNNGIKTPAPFFDSIEIFQLNRAQFTAFSIINPIITDWAHDTMNQAESKLLENKMTVAYEMVQYATGRVDKGNNPAGFATIHYDQEPSPLSILGSGNNSILGPGGIVAGVTELMGGQNGGAEFAYPLGGSTDDPLSAKSLNPLQLARGVVNLANNLKNVSKASLGAEAYSIAGGLLGNLASGKGLSTSGIPGITSNLSNVVAGSAGGLGKVFNNFLGGNSSTNGNTTAGSGGVNRLLNNVTAGGATTRSLLGGSGTGSLADAQAYVAEQQAKLDALQKQKADAELAQQQYDAELAAAKAAGDQAEIDSIMGKMDSSGYTSPESLADQIGAAEAAVADAQNTYLVQKQLDDNAQSEDEVEATDPPDLPPEDGEPDPEISSIEDQDNQDSNETQYADSGSDSSDYTDFA
jgi:hypothetical protein